MAHYYLIKMISFACIFLFLLFWFGEGSICFFFITLVCFKERTERARCWEDGRGGEDPGGLEEWKV